MLSDFRMRKMKKLFLMFDGNKNGYLDEADYEIFIAKASKHRGLQPGSSEYNHLREVYLGLWAQARLFARASQDRVSFDEWLGAQEAVLSNREQFQTMMLQNVTDTMFKLFDANGDGKVSLEEYKGLLEIHGCDARNADTFFKRLDPQARGHLTFEDVKARVEEYSYAENEDAPGNYLFGDL